MTIVHLLERNAKEFAQDVALVEINPDQPETRKSAASEKSQGLPFLLRK